jgi:hypothetical protein
LSQSSASVGRRHLVEIEDIEANRKDGDYEKAGKGAHKEIVQPSGLRHKLFGRGGAFVDISHEFQPVTDVGGNYLDYFQLPDGTIGMYVGDVSGKGLPAALYAALAVGAQRGIPKTGLAPSRV